LLVDEVRVQSDKHRILSFGRLEEIAVVEVGPPLVLAGSCTRSRCAPRKHGWPRATASIGGRRKWLTTPRIMALLRRGTPALICIELSCGDLGALVLTAELLPVEPPDEVGGDVVLLDEVLGRAAVLEVLGEVGDGNRCAPKDRLPAPFPEGRFNGILAGGTRHGRYESME
jgi:hypothetical protein